MLIILIIQFDTQMTLLKGYRKLNLFWFWPTCCLLTNSSQVTLLSGMETCLNLLKSGSKHLDVTIPHVYILAQWHEIEKTALITINQTHREQLTVHLISPGSCQQQDKFKFASKILIYKFEIFLVFYLFERFKLVNSLPAAHDENAIFQHLHITPGQYIWKLYSFEYVIINVIEYKFLA